jgi:hypothetical protein
MPFHTGTNFATVLCLYFLYLHKFGVQVETYSTGCGLPYLPALGLKFIAVQSMVGVGPIM